MSELYIQYYYFIIIEYIEYSCINTSDAAAGKGGGDFYPLTLYVLLHP